jgi:hypothetical protein
VASSAIVIGIGHRYCALGRGRVKSGAAAFHSPPHITGFPFPELAEGYFYIHVIGTSGLVRRGGRGLITQIGEKISLPMAIGIEMTKGKLI